MEGEMGNKQPASCWQLKCLNGGLLGSLTFGARFCFTLPQRVVCLWVCKNGAYTLLPLSCIIAFQLALS